MYRVSARSGNRKWVQSAECRVFTSKVTVQSGNDTVSLAGIEGNTGILSGFGAVGRGNFSKLEK